MSDVGLILLSIAVLAYLLPTIVAVSRGKAEGEGGVFLVNLLLGWTVVGWVVAFIWACTGRTTRDVKLQKKQHQEILAALKEHQRQ